MGEVSIGVKSRAGQGGAENASRHSMEDLERALINADKAGDEPAARILAKEIIRLRGLASPPEASAAPQMSVSMPSTMQGFPGLPQAEGPGIGAELAQIGSGIDKGVRLLAHGATLGTADKFAAGMRGLLPGQTYEAALTDERARSKAAEEEFGPVGSAALKGVGSVGGLVAAQAAGLPVLGMQGLGLMGRTATAAGTMGALGAGAGAINSDGDAEAKAKAAAFEGVTQAGVGMAGPLLGAGVGAVARPVMARLRPATDANRRIAAALSESGRPVSQIADDMALAHAEGQPMYSFVDALGNPGGRALAGAVKQPGPGREMAREALEQRQAGQARRLTGFLEEGFQAPETAVQATARLTARRAEEGARNYAAARNDAGAVDVSGALASIDRTLSPGASRAFSSALNIADDTVEAALRRARSLLAHEGDGQAAQGTASGWGAYNRGAERIVDFQAAHRAMLDIGDMADAAMRAGRNNQARLLGEVRRELDTALTKASPSYAAARDAYAAGSRQIEAVETGANAATRGRSEDVLRTFGAMSPEEQAAFRHGYADRYIQSAQGAAAGSNTARALTSDAVRTEFPVMAGGERAPRLMRQIDRENQMYATRQNALGGSSTFENAADAGGAVTGVIESLLSGRTMTAASMAIGRALNAMGGSTAESRRRLVELLMERSPDAVRSLTQNTQVSEGVRRVARALWQTGATEGANRALPGSAR